MNEFCCTVLDTETTGLDPSVDRIISIAACQWSPSGIGSPFSIRVLPPHGTPISPEAQRINGYDEATWIQQGAVPFSAAHAMMFAPLLEGQNICGCSPRFDVDFLRWEFYRIGVPFPDINRRLLDITSMATPLLVAGELRSLSLVSLAAYFGIDTAAAHTAEGDVWIEIQVFEALLSLFLGAKTQ